MSDPGPPGAYDTLADVRRVRDELAAKLKGLSPAEKLELLRREAEAARRERLEPPEPL